MRNRDNIEDIFHDAFSNWEPEVHGGVKTKIDDEIFRNKPEFFSRFKWILFVLFFALTSAVAWILMNPSTTETAKIQEQNAISSSQGQTENPKASKGTHKNSASSNQENSKTLSRESSDEESIIQQHTDLVKEAANNTTTENDVSDFQQRPASIKNKKSGGIETMNAGESISKSSETSTIHQSNNATTNLSKSQQEMDLTKSQKPATDASHLTNETLTKELSNQEAKQENIAAIPSRESSVEASDSITSNTPDTIPLTNENPFGFLKTYALGVHFGLHSGRNSLSNNLGVFDESRNLSLGIDFSYQFSQRHRFSSGFHYQRRIEHFEQNSAQVDSTLISSEPIFEIVVPPNSLDTIFVVVGYNNIYDYDTNFVFIQKKAMVQLFMLPLAYDFRVFGLNNHTFWIRSGANMGIYRTTYQGDLPGLTNIQNSFSMQLLVRPYYAMTFGKLELGLFGNFGYDIVLPQTFGLNRKRWQSGFGLQFSYRF